MNRHDRSRQILMALRPICYVIENPETVDNGAQETKAISFLDLVETITLKSVLEILLETKKV